jgi:hypothetical protein
MGFMQRIYNNRNRVASEILWAIIERSLKKMGLNIRGKIINTV